MQNKQWVVPLTAPHFLVINVKPIAPTDVSEPENRGWDADIWENLTRVPFILQ